MNTKGRPAYAVIVTVMIAWLGFCLASGFMRAAALRLPNRVTVCNRGRQLVLQMRLGPGDTRAYPELLIDDEPVLRIRSSAGGYSPAERAELVFRRLKDLLGAGLDPADIVPGIENGQVIIRAGPELLITVDQSSAEANKTPVASLAETWTNNLRRSLGAKALAMDDMRGYLGRDRVVVARASWYGPRFHGRPTASGEIYDQDACTAAHRTLPFGTMVLVNNPATNRSVLVRINDRGPFVGGRVLDLSRAAARAIGMEDAGIADIQMTVLNP